MKPNSKQFTFGEAAMTDTDLDSDCVDFPCPHCGESRVDLLVWLDDEFVECASCGQTYRHGYSDLDE